jgi:capsular polysaccharide biosynthesis protein
VLLIAAVVLVAVAVSVASLLRTPTYEASAQVWVSPAQGTGEGKIRLIPLAPAPETLRAITQEMVHAIDSRPVAEEAIRRLGLRISPAELLDKLTVEEDAATQFVVLTYEDTDPHKAQQIVNTVGEVSSERISPISAGPPGSKFTATAWDKAAAPESPVSPTPLRNGLFTLVIGLALCAVFLLPRPRLLAARVAGNLVGPPVRPIREAELPIDPSEAKLSKEQELLQALRRRGKLTAVEAAVETSLSVEEADRILSELAYNGHLQVIVEHGRLYYAFWERD